MDKSKITVAVGMSGGVDSSTVAYLLKNEGYNVIGITMKHWHGMNIEKASESKTCCSLEDVHDAKRVCDDLDIKHYTINFEKEFQEEVVENFVEEYKKGRTPNPCVICNRKIKLGKLIDFAKKIGADYLATGHYAKIKDENIYRGIDENKDQAYFLAQVKKEYVKYLMFPLGGYEKTEVKKIAKELGVRTYSKKDSQEICFIEDDDYKRFLKDYTHDKILKPGNIVLEDGTVLGKHECKSFYTIGQRKGLGVSWTSPLYVLGIDGEKNNVIVGENEKLFTDEVNVSQINLLSVDTIDQLDNINCFVKTRSRDRLHAAKLKLEGEDKILVVLTEDKARAITPGQVVVFYDEDDMIIASGFID